MSKYHKKTVTVEAFQWNVDITPQWAANAFFDGILTEANTGINIELHIETLKGEMIAKPENFIIKGVHGEIYSCKPDIFAETYEEVE